MKRLFSKKSGFTLVEIIIAFAVFAIMSSMVVQILNLTIKRKVANQKYEQGLTQQEQDLVARGRDTNWDGTDPDDQLKMKLVNEANSDEHELDINYQLRNWDPDGDRRNGINYLVGNISYSGNFDNSTYEEGEDTGDPSDPDSLGGSSVMSRFDTRITGTKGIDSIQIDVQSQDEANKYTVSVTINDSGINNAIKRHSQVTIYFANGKANSKPINVVSVNNGAKDEGSLKQVKPCGLNGVNINCNDSSSGFGGSTVVFTVELEEELETIGFGDNLGDDGLYHAYTYKETEYENIFGAYVKGGDAAPAE